MVPRARGTHANGSECSAATAATIACDPSPPAIASASAPPATARDERLEIVAGRSSTASIPLSRLVGEPEALGLAASRARVEEEHGVGAGARAVGSATRM